MLRTIERPDEGRLAAVGLRGVEHLLDAVHVRGEARHDDPTGSGPEDGLDRGIRSRSDIVKPGTSRWWSPTAAGPPLLAEARERPQVGDAPVKRELVHLEVTGVQHEPCLGA
jgi:hypothetical protein